MFAVKNTDTGLFYTGKKEPAPKWGPRCDARWVPIKATAKAIRGGLRNDRTIAPGALRIVSINE